jgi:formylglycine-generating enzyme required for sulfatase activity/murein DD-endopeptidase MepM/ murein hydrolase activator NlpD
VLPPDPDIEGVVIRVENRTLERIPMSNRNGACDDPTSLQTGPSDPAAPGSPDGLCWQPVEVELAADGRLTVNYKGQKLVDQFETGYSPEPGSRWVVAARTGGANENHHIDNVRIGISGLIGVNNTPPTISNIPNRSVEQNRSDSVSFVIGDSETLPGQLGVKITSSNQALLRDSDILVGGSGSTRTATLVPLNDATGTATLTVTVTDGGGLAATSLFQFTVNRPEGVAPTLTVHPKSQTLTIGATVTLSVRAAGTGPLSYQWSKNGVPLSGASGSTFTIRNFQESDAGNYSVVVSNSFGHESSTALLSLPGDVNTGIVLFNNRIVGKVDARVLLPDGQGAGAGWVAQLYGGSMGTPISQLKPLAPATEFRTTSPAAMGYVNSVEVKVPDVPPGATATIIMRVFEGDSYETARRRGESLPIQLSLGGGQLPPAILIGLRGFSISISEANPTEEPPMIIKQPSSQTALNGSSITFSVMVMASESVSFQWFHDGIAIDSATSNELVLRNVRAEQAGEYTVVATGSGGSTVSTAAQLMLIQALVRNDFNGDGNPDLLFQDDDGFMAVWMMNGPNLVSAKFLEPNRPGDSRYRIVATGDFNGDGKEDVIFQHADGTLAAWFMGGTRLTQGALLTPSNPGDPDWRVVGSGDFNQDNHPDLVFQHADGTLALWRMNGIELSSAALFHPENPGSGWRVVGVGDFSSDSKPDLVFQDAEGTLAVWMLDGNSLTMSTLLEPPNPGPGWRMASAADRNQDGNPDLLFQHTNRDLAAWFMNGTTMQEARLLEPSNPGGTWRVGSIQGPNSTDVDLIEISDEEVPPDPDELYFLSPDLPDILPENTAFPLTLEINDADGEPVSIDGQFTLSLVLANDTPVPFEYTLAPSTVAAVNGVAETKLTIHTVESLSDVFLAVAFFPSTSRIGLQGLGDRRRLAGPTGGAKKIASTRVSYDDYKDTDTKNWGYPLSKGYPIAGMYGEYPGHSAIHRGVDLTAPKGTNVLAAKQGVVIRVGNVGGTQGKYVAVYHGNGIVSIYLHVDPKVERGMKVEKGGVLATVHDWEAPHLHFEMRKLSPADIAIANQEKGFKKFFGRLLKNLGSPVNPISTEFTFSPSLITDDSHDPSVQAIFLSADHPAKRVLSLPPSDPTPDLGSGDYSSKIYVVAQVVDYQTVSPGNIKVLNPKRITFKPDANPGGDREIVYGNTESSILALSPGVQGKGGTGGEMPGYVLLPAAETGSSAFRERRYKYWFDWETSVYARIPGPHGFKLEIEDFAGKPDSRGYLFGPKILHDGQPWLVPDEGTEKRVSVRSRFGPLPNPTGDDLVLDVGYATATVSPSSDWSVDFVDAGLGQSSVERAGLANFSVTSDNQTTDIAMRVRPLRTGVTSGVLTLRVNSAVFEKIYDELTIQLNPEASQEPVPIPAGFVRIPAGTFTMGSPATEKQRILDETQHTVTLTKDFYMSKHEVTQREYMAVMGNNPSRFTGELNRPVEQVSWNDAMSYCAKLTASEKAAGRLQAGWEYRLPTEAEWEYACRAGTRTPFHYGTDLRSGMANFDGKREYGGGTGSVNNGNGSYLARTTTVGSYVANAFGLYDMHGNVWEWCLDWKGAYPAGSVNDPKGPSSGSFRVVRGGGWG